MALVNTDGNKMFLNIEVWTNSMLGAKEIKMKTGRATTKKKISDLVATVDMKGQWFSCWFCPLNASNFCCCFDGELIFLIRLVFENVSILNRMRRGIRFSIMWSFVTSSLVTGPSQNRLQSVNFSDSSPAYLSISLTFSLCNSFILWLITCLPEYLSHLLCNSFILWLITCLPEYLSHLLTV